MAQVLMPHGLGKSKKCLVMARPNKNNQKSKEKHKSIKRYFARGKRANNILKTSKKSSTNFDLLQLSFSSSYSYSATTIITTAASSTLLLLLLLLSSLLALKNMLLVLELKLVFVLVLVSLVLVLVLV